jgi:peptidoglycan hydrolase-like protein with peptidoglycan-binding domain
MNATVQIQADTTPKPSFTPVGSNLLQRKCACGGTPGPSGECAQCRSKRLALQRRAAHPAEPSSVPPIVHGVLRSPGQPLDHTTRSFMEPRFGHDFGRVRVHTDAQAAKSARAVNALAYTVGSNVVFGARQYAPETVAGKRLLAHELAHTVQQRESQNSVTVGQVGDRYEQEADRVSEQVMSGSTVEDPLLDGGSALQRRIGDGHDLTATRFSGNRVLEAAFDDETVLKNGDSGTAVRLIQESLIAQGYNLGPSGADGDFGGDTETAVRQFQIDTGAVLLDGIVGPETMGLLDMHDPGGTTATGPLARPPRAGAPAAPSATGAAFSEHPDEGFAGYDASVVPNWLVVPATGRRRVAVATAPAAARPAFTTLNAAVATVDVASNGVVVTGVAAGTTEIQSREGGTTLDRLRISVKNRVDRDVAFHFVCDSRPAAAGGPHCSNGTPSADEMRSLLNRVWERQANVRFTGGVSHNVVVPGDMGAYVNSDGFGGDEMGIVTAAAPAPATYNVFRVWEVRTRHRAVNNGLNNGNNTLIGDSPCADGWGLPHEAGHSMGLGHGSGFIMAPCGGRTDQRVSKAIADVVNP